MGAVAVVVPQVVEEFGLLQLTVFAALCILALSLGVVLGLRGILCFGQSAFFGLGAYAYAVTAINISARATGGSSSPSLVPGRVRGSRLVTSCSMAV